MVPASGVQTHQSDIPSAAEKDVLAVPLPGRQHVILPNPYAHCTIRRFLLVAMRAMSGSLIQNNHDLYQLNRRKSADRTQAGMLLAVYSCSAI
jgi:hypothetical protein